MQARITREVRTTQEQSAGNSVRVWRQKGWGWRVPARLGAAISAVKSGEPQMRQHCATNASVNPRGSSISGMKAVLIAMRDRIGGGICNTTSGKKNRKESYARTYRPPWYSTPWAVFKIRCPECKVGRAYRIARRVLSLGTTKTDLTTVIRISDARAH